MDKEMWTPPLRKLYLFIYLSLIGISLWYMLEIFHTGDREKMFSWIGYGILFFPLLHQLWNCIQMGWSRWRTRLLVKKKRILYETIQDIEFLKDAECSICLEEFKPKDPVIMLECGCFQIYHPSCIQSWLNVNMSCPLCRDQPLVQTF